MRLGALPGKVFPNSFTVGVFESARSVEIEKRPARMGLE